MKFVGAPSDQMKLISLVGKVATSLYPNYDTEYTIVASAAGMDKNTFKEYFQSQQEKHAIISVDESYVASHKDLLSDFLHKRTGCVVGVFKNGTIHMNHLIYTLRKVISNFIFNLDETVPMIDSMISSDYPILWMEKLSHSQGKSNKQILGLFCPKEDRSRSTILRSLVEENSKVKCPHYLKGQKLGLGYVYGDKKRILDGKEIYGKYYVRFFDYASKKFKFDPWYKLGRIVYFLKNDSWGGLHRDVSDVQ